LGLALAVIGTAQLMVVLDASIVNVALPSIQRALHFSGANLEWVVNAYTLAFGGLLLLGGRIGDLFGKRRMFVIGVGLFSVASLLGGLATDEAWLIAARAIQGIGGAIASPTALALVAATFSEGPERNRAMGVYSAMSGAGGAIGVLLGGVLTNSFSWRWVLFVNVPIGAAVVLLAPRVLPETDRQPASAPCFRSPRPSCSWAASSRSRFALLRPSCRRTSFPTEPARAPTPSCWPLARRSSRCSTS